MAQVKTVYVGNLPERYTEQDLKALFGQFGEARDGGDRGRRGGRRADGRGGRQHNTQSFNPARAAHHTPYAPRTSYPPPLTPYAIRALPLLQVEKYTILHVPDEPTKLRNYAFVNYAERLAALRAVAAADEKKYTIGDKELMVGRRRRAWGGGVKGGGRQGGQGSWWGGQGGRGGE